MPAEHNQIRIAGDVGAGAIVVAGDHAQITIVKGAQDEPAPPTQRGLRNPAFLWCDRAEQWSQLQYLVEAPGAALIFVPARRGMGLDYFVLRIEQALSIRGPLELLRVEWQQRPFPRLLADYLLALAEHLRCDEADVAGTLRRRLLTRTVLLLHPCVREGFESDALTEYYTWLRREIDAPAGVGPLKCVQPIEWRPAGRLLALLARILAPLGARGDWARRAREEVGAHALIDQVRRRAGAPLLVEVLPELSPITAQHVRDLCRARVDPAALEACVARILGGARTSEEVLQAIRDYLPEARPGRIT